MTDNLTDRFIDYLLKLYRSGFPDSAILKAKYCLLDYLGVTMAGAAELRSKTKAFSDNPHTDIFKEALLNGIHAHQLELDDGHRYGMIHPGATVISALLPWVRQEGLTGKDLLAGIIMGYEAAIRLASALQPNMKDKGYHATGTCGTIGAAMGAAFASGYSTDQLKSTLAAACTSASGILEIIRDGSELKPYNAGQAAANGLLAATIGKTGLQGPNDMLGGTHGFIKVMGGNLKNDFLQEADSLAIERIYVKPYAACRHCHPPIEAVQKIISANKISVAEIQSVEVQTYLWAVHLHDHTEIEGVTSAKMSTPFSVAITFVTGKAGIEEFTTASIQDPEVIALTKKVKVYKDEEMTKLVPHKRGALVTAVMRDGQKFSERVDLPKGEPENPLSHEEIKKKFFSLALYGGKSARQAHEIITCVEVVEKRFDDLLRMI